MWQMRFYQYVEKDTNQVSSAWKVLHASVFFATFFCSLISACAFDNIMKSFDHRCILYASPNLNLEEITFKPNSTENSSAIEKEMMNTEISEGNGGTRLTNTSSTASELNDLHLDWSKAEHIPGTNRNILLLDDQFWFSNETLYGKIDMSRSGTTFGSAARCSTVLFIPLLSLIVSAVFGVIVVICGRGGRGYKTDIMSDSWSFVYPVIFVSALMTILSIVATIPGNDGLHSFCSQFENFTGQSRCNHLMNHFTLDGDRVFEDFWGMCITCFYSYSLGLLLWTSQLSITILRFLRVVDFQFNSISVESKYCGNYESNMQKIHEAVVEAFPGAKTITEILKHEDPEEVPNGCIDHDEVTQV